MAITNLGRVLPKPRGEYKSTEPYEVLDLVTSDGRSYFCIKDAPIGIPPTNEEHFAIMFYPPERSRYSRLIINSMSR